MANLRTDAISTVRVAADNPRMIEGVAVPYGMVAQDTELGAEAFAPGAFAASVANWNSRTDGARMAYRPAHGEKPVGTVVGLEDAADGVHFRASIFDTPAGDEYLAQVGAGLNGVSIEAGLNKAGDKRAKDGTIIHAAARLHAIAGSIAPAYDGARIALRDMEGDTTEMADQEVQPTAAEAVTAERSAAERATVTAVVPSTATISITRPELVYKPNGEHGYLRDAYLAQMRGDSDAAERQARHKALLTDVANQAERASDVLSSEIPGMYANLYLPSLLTPRILKGRPMGGFFNRIAIADARPRIFAKVTTSGTVAASPGEGSAFTATDIATTSVTVTPTLYGTYTDISRQAIDGGDPSTEGMVLNDLYEAYAQASETAIKTAVEAGATDSGVAITAATPFAGALANVINYYGVRFRANTGVFIPSAAYSTLLAQADTAGRPLVPWVGPVNSDATVESGAVAGNMLGARAFLSYASTVNVWCFARPEDYVLYESPVVSFSFEQAPGGPHAVRVGVWAYLGIGTRLGALKKTAA